MLLTKAKRLSFLWQEAGGGEREAGAQHCVTHFHTWLAKSQFICSAPTHTMHQEIGQGI